MKNFSFIKNQKISFGIVIAVVIIGIASFFIRGFNIDIDFVGGTEISYDIGKVPSSEDKANIETKVIEIIGKENFSSLRASGTSVIIRTLILDNKDNTAEISANIDEIISGLELGTGFIVDEASTENTRIFTAYADNEVPEDTEEAIPVPMWSDDDVNAIKSALSALETDTLTVELSSDKTELTVEFEATSTVSRYRTAISAAMEEMYDTTADVSASVDGAVATVFPNAILSDESSVNSKVYTMTSDDGEYAWTDEDVTLSKQHSQIPKSKVLRLTLPKTNSSLHLTRFQTQFGSLPIL